MDLLTIDEAASRLQVSVPTVRRMIRSGEFGPGAFKVRKQWRIQDTALHGMGEAPERPRLLVAIEKLGQWAAFHTSRMQVFIELLVQATQPRIILVRHRRGERIIAALKLIPSAFRPRVFQMDYFESLPVKRLQELLTNARVLILDDTVERGRGMRVDAEWLRSAAPGVEVTFGCLFLRESCRGRGDLEIPSVVAYQELEDSPFRIATAELSRIHRLLWPLDEEHPTVWFRLRLGISDEEVEARLAKVGKLVELAPLSSQANMRVLVIEASDICAELGTAFPRTFKSWPGKVRCLWLKDERILVLAGIWFPSLSAGARWLKEHEPSGSLLRFLGVRVEQWNELDATRRARLLFRAMAIYAGSLLLGATCAELARTPTAIEGNSNDWGIEDEDFLRGYGAAGAEQLVQAIREEIRSSVARKVLVSAEAQGHLEVEILRPSGELGAFDFVKPLVTLLTAKARKWALTHGSSEQFPGMTREELNNEIGPGVSQMIDVGADYGHIKPFNWFELLDGRYTVVRAFRASEMEAMNGAPGSGSGSEGMVLHERLLTGGRLVELIFRELNSNDRRFPPQTFHKLLVLAQAGLSGGRVNQGGLDIRHTFVSEEPEMWGPLAFTPSDLIPRRRSVLTYFAEEGALVVPPGKRLPTDVRFDHKKSPEELINEFNHVWDTEALQVHGDIEFAARLYSHLQVRIGDSGAGDKQVLSKGDLLTALAASSTHERFKVYGLMDLRIWREAAQGFVLDARERHHNLVDRLQTMNDSLSALKGKTVWYATLPVWRNAIEKFPTAGLVRSSKENLLRRMDSEVRIDEGTRAIFTIVPTLERFFDFVRLAATNWGSAGTFAKQSRGTAYCENYSPFDAAHESCNTLEAITSLRSLGFVEVENCEQQLTDLAAGPSSADPLMSIDQLRDVWITLDSLIGRAVELARGGQT